jgi:hypothetical protein
MSEAAGLAALSICESMLLSLTETKVIGDDEARAILEDAAAAHCNAVLVADGSADDHQEVAAIIESIIGGNSVRRDRGGDGEGAAAAPDGTGDGR